MTSSSQTTVSDAGYPKVLYLILLVAEVLFLFFLVSYSIGSTAGYAEGSTAGYNSGYRQATETGKKIWYDRRSNYDPAYFQIPTK